MKKVLFGILAMLITATVVADPRIELDNDGAGNDTAHIPFDPNNTGNELKVAIERGGSLENPGTGQYSPSASGSYWAPNWTETTGLPLNKLVRYTCQGTGNNLNANIDNTAFTCTTCEWMLFPLDTWSFSYAALKSLPSAIAAQLLNGAQDDTIYWAVSASDCTAD